MCSNYIPATPVQLRGFFKVPAPAQEYRPEVYPCYQAPIIRKPDANAGIGERSCVLAMFGIVPYWADIKLARQTYNARTETVATKSSFRSAYRHGHFCIVPAASIFEPAYGSGKAEREEIANASGEPLGIAGIWDFKNDGPDGLPLISFSMLTISAAGHGVMSRYHRATDEKRMLVLLRPDQFDPWLSCGPEQARDFFEQYPAELMATKLAPKVPKLKYADLFDHTP